MHQPALFLLQLILILAACRAAGWIARRLGQPGVVGEMIAGLVLGPSVFGQLSPQLFSQIFPPASLEVLRVAGNVGVGLYMFIVGLDFRGRQLITHSKVAAGVSVGGLGVPCVLGCILAWAFHSTPGLFAEGATLTQKMLFMAAGISVTAFPMLARIIQERKLTETKLGTITLSAGAFDDAVAWCLLAGVTASFGASGLSPLWTIGGSIAYAVLALVPLRILMRPLGREAQSSGALSSRSLSIALFALVIGMWFTEMIGIHAVFGGFIMGLAMPRGKFTGLVKQVLEPLTVLFLVPIFFTLAGLYADLSIMAKSPGVLWIALLVLAAAVIGKLVACYGAARLCGVAHGDAFAIGALMNARGLMGLLLAEIGLRSGIVQPNLYSVMIAMTGVTTLVAFPLFQWSQRAKTATRQPE